MSEVIDNPVIKDEEIGSRLRELSMQIDSGAIEADDVPNVVTAPKPAAEVEATPAETEAKAARARDEKGKFTKVEDAPAPTEPTEPVAKTEPTVSEYEQAKAAKAAKEKERQDRSWEALNKEKDRLAQEREQIRAEREQAQKQATQKPPRQFQSSQLIAAYEDLDAEADRALAEGDPYTAAEKRKLAKQALQQANEAYRAEKEESTKAEADQFNQNWVTERNKVFEQFPESKDANTPIGKEIQSIFNEHHRLLFAIPNGFSFARDIAQLRLDAASAKQMKADLEKANAELKRLTGLTSISGAGVTSPTAPKSFDQMSEAQQGAMLRSAALEHDAFA